MREERELDGEEGEVKLRINERLCWRINFSEVNEMSFELSLLEISSKRSSSFFLKKRENFSSRFKK